MELSTVLAVGLGGGIGAITRVTLGSIMPQMVFKDFPLPILIINILGCFLMGLLFEVLTLYWSPSFNIRSFLISGFLGGFTTFSAFSLEFALLVEKKLYVSCFLYIFLSIFLSLCFFFLGSNLIKTKFFGIL